MCKDETIINDPIISLDQATTVSLPIPRDIKPRDGKTIGTTIRVSENIRKEV
ncbi:MAG: hypothetical protein WCS08_06850 [Eubacteriales bacterium]